MKILIFYLVFPRVATNSFKQSYFHCNHFLGILFLDSTSQNGTASVTGLLFDRNLSFNLI
uniref:Uncharacterized protein n=1 Tax=Rhizophora mucronata TaxID=61149 RepID=A0A2P2Q5H3_RHIMU